MSHTKNARRVLELVRYNLRDMKRRALDTDTPTRLGALADHISECIEGLDDDIVMACSLSLDNSFEIRVADKRNLKFEDIEMILDMLRLTQDSLERRGKKMQSVDQPTPEASA